MNLEETISLGNVRQENPNDMNNTVDILLVDDDDQNLFTIKSILDDPSLNVIECRSGQEVLRQLLHKDVAVILLDVHMPGMDGFETAKLIRTRAKNAHIPIIFITAYRYDDVDVSTGYTHGAVDFLFNPIKPDILRAKVRTFVELYKKNKQIEEQKNELEKLRDHLEDMVARRTSALKDEIGERKKVEIRLKDSLKEKNVLLAEVHHRVKNNLAVVSALLKLERDNQQEKKLQDILMNSISRIQTMAIIHEKLYKAENFVNLEFKNYIEDLIGSISLSHQNEYKKININTNIDNILINLNQAIPCALLMNELLINSFKHAFKNRMEGNICVNLTEKGDTITLEIKDDGVGLPEGFKLQKSKSLGINLVTTWARQLRADLQIRNKNGTGFIVQFPKSDQPGSVNAHYK